VELSGVFVAEHGIGRKNLAAVERFKSSLELDLIQGLKDLLDPAGIMNPGKTIPVRKATSDCDR
jgi:FAD/FMN-containing dehydrogenase